MSEARATVPMYQVHLAQATEAERVARIQAGMAVDALLRELRAAREDLDKVTKQRDELRDAAKTITPWTVQAEINAARAMVDNLRIERDAALADLRVMRNQREGVMASRDEALDALGKAIDARDTATASLDALRAAWRRFSAEVAP